MMTFKTISVIGLGYIGLPTAAMFASHNKKVIGIDVNQDVVDKINKGEVHIVEPGLDILVKTAVTRGLFKASTVPEVADAFLIAVPTPFLQNEKKNHIPEPDLRFIKSAAKSIAPVLKNGDLVILESTSPVGASEKMAAWLAKARPDLTFPETHGEESDIRIAHCPERVLPGKAIFELVENDRIIGGITDKCSHAAVALYKTFVKGSCVITDARTAEMAKLTENSCRDVQIAFANELSIICDTLGIDVWELISLANRHPRINILKPGPGVGGHCIAVDPWFIISKSPDQAQLIHTARRVNDAKPDWVINKVKIAIANYLQKNTSKTIKDITIACFGLAFKPDIDDLRESPALEITKKIAAMHSGRVIAVEPNIKSDHESLTNIELVEALEANTYADIKVLLVDHAQFKLLKPTKGDIIDVIGIWS